MKLWIKIAVSGLCGAALGIGGTLFYDKIKQRRSKSYEEEIKEMNSWFEKEFEKETAELKKTIEENKKIIKENKKIIKEYGGATSLEKPPLEELKEIVTKSFDDSPDSEDDEEENAEVISEDDYSDPEYEDYEKLMWVYYEDDDMMMQDDQLVTDEEMDHYLCHDIGLRFLYENLSKDKPRVMIRNHEAKCDIEILWAQEWGYNG